MAPTDPTVRITSRSEMPSLEIYHEDLSSQELKVWNHPVAEAQRFSDGGPLPTCTADGLRRLNAPPPMCFREIVSKVGTLVCCFILAALEFRECNLSVVNVQPWMQKAIAASTRCRSLEAHMASELANSANRVADTSSCMHLGVSSSDDAASNLRDSESRGDSISNMLKSLKGRFSQRLATNWYTVAGERQITAKSFDRSLQVSCSIGYFELCRELWKVSEHAVHCCSLVKLKNTPLASTCLKQAILLLVHVGLACSVEQPLHHVKFGL